MSGDSSLREYHLFPMLKQTLAATNVKTTAGRNCCNTMADNTGRGRFQCESTTKYIFQSKNLERELTRKQ